MYWGQYPVCRTNDNAFIFNRMLGYSTVFFDDIDNKWQFDPINDLSVTCYIKYSKNHYTCIQPYQVMKKKISLNLEKMSVLFQGQMCILLPKFKVEFIRTSSPSTV